MKGNPMATPRGEGVTQASVPTDLVQNVVNPNFGFGSHCGGVDSPTPVLVELLRQVSPLCSEDPEAILCFFVQVEEIYELGLVDDRTFVTRILPPSLR
jgi:hypothetical protein